MTEFATPARRCLACQSHVLAPRIDFGPQPLSNRLLTSPNEDEATFGRSLIQCAACGLLQFEHLIPPGELRPRIEASRFNEPEGHLDEMTANILAATTLHAGDLAVGLCYKDASTLDRLAKISPARTVILDTARDLGDASPTAGLETIQALLDEKQARRFADRHGKAKVVVARHFLEHAQDFECFSNAVRALLTDDGLLILEEPDFSIPLDTGDCSTIWEERSVFFTPATLQASLRTMGFMLSRLDTHGYPLENALVAIATPGQRVDADTPDLAGELARGVAFASDALRVKHAVREYLEAVVLAGKEVAIFGAGHMSSNFINLLGIGDVVAFSVDDHPKKCGRFLPGSRVPILPSEALNDRNAGLCLLSVRPEIENAIMAKFPAFAARGGVFASILPRGPLSLRNRIFS